MPMRVVNVSLTTSCGVSLVVATMRRMHNSLETPRWPLSLVLRTTLPGARYRGRSDLIGLKPPVIYIDRPPSGGKRRSIHRESVCNTPQERHRNRHERSRFDPPAIRKEWPTVAPSRSHRLNSILSETKERYVGPNATRSPRPLLSSRQHYPPAGPRRKSGRVDHHGRHTCRYQLFLGLAKLGLSRGHIWEKAPEPKLQFPVPLPYCTASTWSSLLYSTSRHSK